MGRARFPTDAGEVGVVSRGGRRPRAGRPSKGTREVVHLELDRGVAARFNEMARRLGVEQRHGNAKTLITSFIWEIVEGKLKVYRGRKKVES